MRTWLPVSFAAIALTALTAGCGARDTGQIRSAPDKTRATLPETGIASWYGPTFHGRPTASGEPYNMLALSAAHRTLPLGTWVRVENKTTGLSLVLRVNDRGPYVDGRIIDLSYAAAKILDLQTAGTARVRVTVMQRDLAERIAARQARIMKRRGVAAWSKSDFAQVAEGSESS